MKGYEVFAQLLKGYGVTHIFNMPAILRPAFKELEKNGINIITNHSEGAAGCMADGYARSTGKPGVCMAQSIGAGNLVGGIYDAYLANSPVIAITGKRLPVYHHKNSYQETDHRLMYEGITKFNAETWTPEQFPFLFHQCFREATTGQARPVHLDVMCQNGRVLSAAEIEAPVYVEETYKIRPAYRPAAQPEFVEKAAIVLNESKRPLIVAGRGTIISGAHKEIYELARKGDIPVATTPDGKTIIDESDSLWAGVIGEYGMACANKAAVEADIVILIGTQANEQVTLDWTCPPPGTKVIHIDIEPSELGKNYPKTIGLAGDAKVITAQLTTQITQKVRPEWRKQVNVYVETVLKEYDERQSADTNLMQPERLCKELSAALPDDAIVVADTGFSAVWSAIMLRMKPTQSYYRAAGSLGWAFPASLGAKCGNPNRPVVCFTGDGAMMYHLAEMETAVRCGINAVVVVNNNGGLSQSTKEVKPLFADEETMGSRYYAFDVNLTGVAQNLGCHSVRVTSPDQIGQEVQKALRSNKPAIIEVMTDMKSMTPNPLSLIK